MAININAPIKSGAMDSNYNLLPDLNIYYGPYSSKSEAISSITTLCGDNAVPLGVKFAVVSSGTLTEYQYKTGAFNDTNCIEIGSGSNDVLDAAVSKVEEMYEDLNGGENTISIEASLESGGYFGNKTGAQDNVFVSGTGYHTPKFSEGGIDISDYVGKTIKIAFSQVDSSGAGRYTLVTDAQGYTIDTGDKLYYFIEKEAEAFSDGTFGYRFEIPQGAKLLFVCCKPNATLTISVETGVDIGQGLKLDVAQLKQDVTLLDDKVDSLDIVAATTEKEELTVEFSTGYYSMTYGTSTNGEIQFNSSGGRYAEPIDVSQYIGKRIEFVFFPYTAGSARVSVLTYADGSPIQGTVVKDGEAELRQDGKYQLIIDIVEGSKYLYLSYKGGTNNTQSVNVVTAKENVTSRVDKLEEEIHGSADNPFAKILDNAGMMEIFLNVGCIGDSLSSGECISGPVNGEFGYNDLYQYSWGQYLARMTGNKYYNFSKGGLSTKTFLQGLYPNSSQFDDGDHLCEAYTIGLAQNDYNDAVENEIDFAEYIGTTADINTETDSFYGRYSKIIANIKEIQPKAKIFVFTDPLQTTEEAGFNDAIRHIAENTENVYLVDLYRYGSQLYDNLRHTRWYRYGHFSACGYRMCALYIATYIDYIIRHNPKEFEQVEFIGTNFSATF